MMRGFFVLFIAGMLLFAPTFAQAAVAAQPTAGVGAGTSSVPTTIVSISPKCDISAETMKKLDSLVQELQVAQKAGDKDAQEKIMIEIRAIKEAAEKDRQTCLAGYIQPSGGVGGGSTGGATGSAGSNIAITPGSSGGIVPSIGIGTGGGGSSAVAKPTIVVPSKEPAEKPSVLPYEKPTPSTTKPTVVPTPSSSGVLGYIAYWGGKVNQHKSTGGSWGTDQDGVSGAQIPQLDYCKKWFPQSRGVNDIGYSYIGGWKTRGNLDNFNDNGVVYECLADEKMNIVTRFDYGLGYIAWQVGGQPSTKGIEKATVSQTSQITGYYKEKMSGILQQGTSTEEQVVELKVLRDEIDKLIEKLLQTKTKIDATDVGQLVNTIEVSPTAIKAGNVQVASAGKVISAKVRNSMPITIEGGKGKVTLSDGATSADASALTVAQGVVMVGNSEVKVTPSEASGKVAAATKTLAIAEEQGKPVYNIEAQKNARFLGVLPVKMGTSTKVSADSGNIISEKAPWWSDLAIVDK